MNRSKTAIITGASSGLGIQLCREYLLQGYFVVGVARAQPASWLIEKPKFKFLEGDLRNDAFLQQIQSFLEEHGQLDCLVNCAGKAHFSQPSNLLRPTVEKITALNLIAPIVLSSIAVPFLEKSCGTLINILSTAALEAKPNEPVYCATKQGLKAFADSMRQALTPSGVRVLSIFPGGMDTPLWAHRENATYKPDKLLDPGEVSRKIYEFAHAKDSAAFDLVLRRTPERNDRDGKDNLPASENDV